VLIVAAVFYAILGSVFLSARYKMGYGSLSEHIMPFAATAAPSSPMPTPAVTSGAIVFPGPQTAPWTAAKTWEKNHQQIEARRIGPPRSLGPLAPAKKGADGVS
jgi:hypothetical protein